MGRVAVAVDVGGTFTDLVAFDNESGRFYTKKLPSVPARPEEGILGCVRELLKEGVEPRSIVKLVHAGTVGTNLLRGQMGLNLPTCALLTTYGFRDLIEIGRQNRPELYNVFFERPRPLVERELRFDVKERTDHTGRVTGKPNEKEIVRLARKLRKSKVESVAICFLNSYVNGENEQMVRDILDRFGFEVHASCQVDPQLREYERTSTTVVNALLAPVVSRYLQKVNESMSSLGVTCGLQVLSSSGGLIDQKEATSRPISAIESGPAAGVMGAAVIARLNSLPRVISFDMGGTTAKAGAIVDFRPLMTQEMEVGGKVHMGRMIKGSGYPVRYPSVDLAEVSAGGGTVVWVDESGSPRVGPLSAGADPGPVCYGKGGNQPTITDANLHLGRLASMLGGEITLNPTAATRAIERLGEKQGMNADAVASGAIEHVNSQMSRAINIVSRERGLDPREFVLVAFGGAGPMHAAELAESVYMTRVIVPPHPGLFSAIGMLATDMKYSDVMGLVASLAQVDESAVEESFRRMEEALRRRLEARGLDLRSAALDRSVDARYEGQGYEIEVPLSGKFSVREIETRFGERHEHVYGFKHERRGIEVVALRVQITVPSSNADVVSLGPQWRGHGMRRRVWLAGGWTDAEVLSREQIAGVVPGPLIVEEYDSTIVVPPNWTCSKLRGGCISMELRD